ncbi:MAG TPA: RloB domain-containing protein [Ignavibacteria bacterium]|nr:RloB domain-containing protein [Ignavibacteria bacterium]
MSKRFHRKQNTRKQFSFIYIFAEGKRTEPIYFEFKKKEIEKTIRREKIKIKINSGGYKGGNNTLSLVNLAIDFVTSNEFDSENDECWVVFDKDGFDKYFNNAINRAEKRGIKVAYSNEAFELWFLLHFIPLNTAIGRIDYNEKITENYRKATGDKKYNYNKVGMVYPLIEIIKNKESDAIKNAKRLLKQFKDEKSFVKKNPSTTVHLLVERLNKLKE